jgi:hypothetical protein
VDSMCEHCHMFILSLREKLGRESGGDTAHPGSRGIRKGNLFADSLRRCVASRRSAPSGSRSSWCRGVHRPQALSAHRFLSW